MNKDLDELYKKAESHICELQKETVFSKINVEMSFLESQEGTGLKISSNAGMWLSHSFAFEKKISEFIHKAFEEITTQNQLAVALKFKKKEISEDTTKSEKTSSSKGVIQQEIAEFNPVSPKYKLEDVILPEDTRKSIEDAISTIENFDIVYNLWGFKSKEPSAKTNICFFGAPGTGKTMCAHAIAHRLGKQILIASYADIQSQYVGVGPKNLKAVFQKAEEKNAVLFFDEADSFLRKRSSDNSSSASMHYNSMTNEMMKHLEDFNGVVIFATNLTENTDEAFKTRLSFSIEFKVPDEECRTKIIAGMIPSQVPLENPFTEEDYKEMAKVCDGMVGRDIRNSVKTILSVGAQKHSYPFSKEHFIEGFKSYKENKDSFNKNEKKNEKANPMDIYTANGCIHNLLTYVAWVDGKENEIESENLKLFSKILSRNKLVINSISDLPEFEEICHEVTDVSLKKKVMRYFAYFMANTKQDDSLYEEYTNKLAKSLSLDAEFVSLIYSYYVKSKEVFEIKEQL